MAYHLFFHCHFDVFSATSILLVITSSILTISARSLSLNPCLKLFESLQYIYDILIFMCCNICWIYFPVTSFFSAFNFLWVYLLDFLEPHEEPGYCQYPYVFFCHPIHTLDQMDVVQLRWSIMLVSQKFQCDQFVYYHVLSI